MRTPPAPSAPRSCTRFACFTAIVGTLLVTATPGCGDDASADGVAGHSNDAGLDARADGAKADAPPDTSADTAPPQDASDATNPDAPADQLVTDGMNDGPVGDQGTPEASCQTDLILLALPGTTSACSFPVPASVDHDLVNVLMGGRLCEQGSHNCNPMGGWFWIGDEVALCDDTCLAWENSGAKLYLEVGCASESCYVPCSDLGGVCGNGINYCCVGTQCENGTCSTCTKGGEICGATSDCCSGSCEGGVCVGGLGGACISNAGCSMGTCQNNVCKCAPGEISCNAGCVSYTDPMNCRGCGNVCQPDRICTVDGCVCDPLTGFPDECAGVCVNKSNDRTNCGACSYVCPKLEQVCIDSLCGCPSGMTECNGNCVDTNTSQSHCGGCNQGCSIGNEVCSGGTCECALGYTFCTDHCVNLLTDKYNCATCGHACVGNKTCNNGTCG